MNLREQIVSMEQREAELEPRERELWVRVQEADKAHKAACAAWLEVSQPLQDARKTLAILRKMEGGGEE